MRLPILCALGLACGALQQGCAVADLPERDAELERAMQLLLETADADARLWPTPEPAAAPKHEPPRPLPAVSLYAAELPVSQIARGLAELTGANFLLDAGVDAPATLQLRNLPMDLALDSLARSAGLVSLRLEAGGEADGRAPEPGAAPVRNRPLFRLASADSLQRGQASRQALTRMRGAASQGGANLQSFALQHGAPEQVAGHLRAVFGQDLAVIADQRTRSLLARASPQTLQSLGRVLRDLDRPRPLLYLEAWVLEVDDDLASALGLHLASLLGDGDVAGGLASAGQGPLDPAGDEAALLDGDIADAQWGIGVLDDGRSRLLRITALAREGYSRILSHPRIFVEDGATAEVFQGEEIPYVTSSGEGRTNTEFRQAGLRLQVTPHYLGHGLLGLGLEVSKDSVDQRRQNPPISRREIRTQMRLPLGATLAIGGIRVQRSHRNREGLVLGSKERSHQDVQLVVLLRVTEAGGPSG